MTYTLAVVGATGHPQLVLAELAEHPEIRLTAIAPSYPGEDMTQYDSLEARRFSAWRDLLDIVPDILVVCARHDLTAAIAIEGARHDCHLICEKPAAQSLEQLHQIADLVARRGLIYCSMLPMRYQATFFTARQVVVDGLIGEPLLVSAQKSYRWGQRPAWYAQRETYGSTINWVGIHAFDYARWVSGREYTTVSAQHSNGAHPERPGCQDVAGVMARLDNGGTAVFHLDYLRPDAAHSHGDDRLRIAGSRGVVEVTDCGQRLHVITDQVDEPDWPLLRPTRTLFGDFCATLEGTGELLVTAEDAFAVTRFAILATQSADSGQEIRIASHSRT